MIDLHTHCEYSDGTNTVKEILEKANKYNLEVLSITDHDTCDAYFEMENLHIEKLFKGKIVVGCEFFTSFENKSIELLGYGFDYKMVSKYLKTFYTNELKEKINRKIKERLINKIINNKLKCNLEKVKNISSNKILREIYYELIIYPENIEILNEDIFSSRSDFIRKGINNSNSKMFLNIIEFRPNIKEIIDLIHNAGGKVFLAHPYQYKYDNTEEFIEKLYNKNNLDGIECFYTTFNDKQTNYLLNFAKERNLLISGGSDYHGENKINHDLGVGKGNLNINKNIMSNWNICYYK